MNALFLCLCCVLLDTDLPLGTGDSRRPLTAGARVRSQVSPRENYGGLSGTETGLSVSAAVTQSLSFHELFMLFHPSVT